MKYKIGKYYFVKCVELLNSNGIRVDIVPVIGEAHRDPQFGVDRKHYHIDGRFLSTDSYILHKKGKTNQVILCKDKNDDSPLDTYAGDEVVRRLKCKRSTTGILPPEKGKYQDWYNSFVGKSCRGKKCPHLGQKMIEEDGRLVCPLHNLKGCHENEVIIPFFD